MLEEKTQKEPGKHQKHSKTDETCKNNNDKTEDS
jgi:hypothetical protein